MKSARLLRRLRKQIKRSQTHILLAAALAALGACAPLAEVSKTEPKLGAQDGTIAELRRAEQAIADAQKLKRTDPNRGRPNSRVTRCHFDHSNANRVFMSRSNRPYGFTCSQISGVSAA